MDLTGVILNEGGTTSKDRVEWIQDYVFTQ